MNQRRMPSYLREIFGEKQRITTMIGILLFGFSLAGLLYGRYPEMYENIPWWRSLLAFVLIFDIFCGCIANFTRSTNDYYAANSRKRLLFISVHIHLLLVGLLLESSLLPYVWVWLYTVAGAYVVNALPISQQLLTAGTLLCAGIGWIPVVLDLTPSMLIVSELFMLKVLFSFSVDHYGRSAG
ncbi:hypothetical protein [Paenibacillus sp. YYML68]|uniref:hypothetical protein n=1 Tax=Paenibacillus sp. YYML68 TaxID=2909250 RepID=UPI00249251B0|nr:hypothetical protein [Paenibacillus sp. YYML68]